MTRKQLTYARVVFAVYIVAVLVLCFAKFPGSDDVPMELWGIPMDKLVHFLMFFPLPLLAYLAFDRYREKRRGAAFGAAVTFLGGCVFAAFTELVQSRLAYRSGDPADFKADAIALVASSVIVLIVILAKHQK